MIDETLRQRQSFQIIEFLIDLIHGDLIRGDKACRRVVDALIAIYEDAIRKLVSSNETLLTPALKGAINAYCARHVLRAAPELLIASKEAAAAYKQIADVLMQVEEMKEIGEAIAKELSHLTRRLETRRFSHLLDLMGTAVVMYMQKAAKEHEEENTQENVLLLQVESAFWVSVKRFLETSTITITGGDMNNNSNNNNNNNKDKDKENNNNCKSNKRLRLEDGESLDSSVTPPRGFSEEMRRVVISPVRNTRIPAINIQRLACAQEEQEIPSSTDLQQKLNETEKKNKKKGKGEKEQIPIETANNGRAIMQLDNSVVAMVEEMEVGDHSKVIQNTSSIAVDTTDNSMEAPQMSSATRKRKGVVVVAGVNDSDVSLLGNDVHVRSYFLCAETKRYEPVTNQGFFS